MCKFSSKSGGVPFQISFFLGDLTRNDPNEIVFTCAKIVNKYELSIYKGTGP